MDYSSKRVANSLGVIHKPTDGLIRSPMKSQSREIYVQEFPIDLIIDIIIGSIFGASSVNYQSDVKI